MGKLKKTANDISLIFFTSLLFVIFSKQIGLIFLVRVISYMLKLHICNREITNSQMLKIVLMSLIFAHLHLIQSIVFTLGFILKVILSFVWYKLN